jgi:hypothetical protein
MISSQKLVDVVFVHDSHCHVGLLWITNPQFTFNLLDFDHHFAITSSNSQKRSDDFVPAVVGPRTGM